MIAFSLNSLRRRPGQLVLALGLAAMVILAWLYLLAGAGLDMRAVPMDAAGMTMPAVWTLGYGVQIYAMWATMMVAMMLPSAAPSLWQWTGPAGERFDGRPKILPAMAFGAGYLLVWAGFSLAATLLQWALDSSGLLSAMMALRNGLLSGAVILLAGVYQLTPFKLAALQRCRASAACRPSDQAQGFWTVTRLGVRHGLACLAGCWGLMGLLFVVGPMNLAGIAAIALWVLLEENWSWGSRLARLGGAALIVWGAIALTLAR